MSLLEGITNLVDLNVNNLAGLDLSLNLDEHGEKDRRAIVAGAEHAVLVPRREMISSLHESLVLARSAVEDQANLVNVPESAIHSVLDKLKVLEEEVNAMLDGKSDEAVASASSVTPENPTKSTEAEKPELAAQSATQVPEAASKIEQGGDDDDQPYFPVKLASDSTKASATNSAPKADATADTKETKETTTDLPAVAANASKDKPTADVKVEVGDRLKPLPFGGLMQEKVAVSTGLTTEVVTSTKDDTTSTITSTRTRTTTVTIDQTPSAFNISTPATKIGVPEAAIGTPLPVSVQTPIPGAISAATPVAAQPVPIANKIAANNGTISSGFQTLTKPAPSA